MRAPSARTIVPAMDRIRGFDGLRAIALIAVFLQHFTKVGADLELGGYGVWLFFVLSGFLIVRILVGERRRIEAGVVSRGAAIGRFYWRRTLRIAPPYYLVLAGFTGAAAFGATEFTLSAAPWFWAHLSNVYFIAIAGEWVRPLAPMWSLAVEEQFYLLAAPALLLLVPSRSARSLCAATVLAAFACDLTLRSGGASEVALYANPLTNFGAIAFGGWLALGLPARVGAGTASAPALVGLGLVVAVILGVQQVGALPRTLSTLVSGAPFWAATLLSGLAVAGVYRNQASFAVRALEWAPIAMLGRLSYGFYLYHAVLPHWTLTGAMQRLGWSWRPPETVEAGFAFAVALGLALASWRWLERPLLALKDRPPRVPTRARYGYASAHTAEARTHGPEGRDPDGPRGGDQQPDRHHLPNGVERPGTGPQPVGLSAGTAGP